MQNSHEKIAIMQPYLFPYIGYFQLISAVDKFVLYDDVQWIKGGWINRHTILLNHQEKKTVLSVSKHSTFSLINEVFINSDSSTKINYLNSIKNSYSKAPCFKIIYPIIQDIFNIQELNMSEFILNSFLVLKNVLDIKTEFLLSSSLNYDRSQVPTKKLIDMCKILSGDTYINTIKGEHLYNKADFAKENINLLFLDRVVDTYKQFDGKFVPCLSIIDVLMFNGIEKTKSMIKEFDLK